MQNRFALAGVVTLAALIGCTTAHTASTLGPLYPITTFGAIGDAATLNTAAIQSSIDHAAASGGGTVVIPKGVFLSGSIFLKPGVNLHLDQGAVLKGSTNISDYPLCPTRIEGHATTWIPALINADGIDHLQIAGPGTLDGSGKPFWEEFWRRRAADKATKNLDVPRPRLMFLKDCHDLSVSHLTLKNSGFWNLHLYRCDNAAISALDISAPPHSPSTDGIDIDSCQNVTVRDCHISTDDDCIALKGSKGPDADKDSESPPVSNIHVTGCTMAMGNAILTCGSEATYIHDIEVDHCNALPTNSCMLRLKLRPDTPQRYENISVHDIHLDGPGKIISIEPWNQYFDLKGHAPPNSIVRNITVSNVTGSFGSFGIIHGHPHGDISHITLKNINVQLDDGQLKLGPVTDLVIKDVIINGKPYTTP
jgi:polygalacturonase